MNKCLSPDDFVYLVSLLICFGSGNVKAGVWKGGEAGIEQVFPSLLALLKHKKCSCSQCLMCNLLVSFDFTQCCIIAVGVIKYLIPQSVGKDG